MGKEHIRQSHKTQPQIKICGITRKEDIDSLFREHVDYMGMVLFFEKSKRNLSIEQAKELIAYVRGGNAGQARDLQTVAVVVSPDRAQVKAIEMAGFDYIQIHGELSEEVYESIEIPIIRAINVSGEVELAKTMRQEKIEAILFDGSTPGAGKTFDWRLIDKIDRTGKTLILAGGINEENVAEAIQAVQPDVIDVSSSVEYLSGAKGKDPERIHTFVTQVRSV